MLHVGADYTRSFQFRSRLSLSCSFGAPLRANMDAARGVLAQTARSSPLPLAARDEVSSFLELFRGVPASTAVLKQMCEHYFCEPELLVQQLAADTRVVLHWVTEESRGRRRCAASIVWQQWVKADAAPWSVDLSQAPMAQLHAHRQQVALAAHSADLSPRGLMDLIDWCKRTWRAAALGPCSGCETAALKRLCLTSTKLCARCSLARAITG